MMCTACDSLRVKNGLQWNCAAFEPLLTALFAVDEVAAWWADCSMTVCLVCLSLRSCWQTDRQTVCLYACCTWCLDSLKNWRNSLQTSALPDQPTVSSMYVKLHIYSYLKIRQNFVWLNVNIDMSFFSTITRHSFRNVQNNQTWPPLHCNVKSSKMLQKIPVDSRLRNSLTDIMLLHVTRHLLCLRGKLVGFVDANDNHKLDARANWDKSAPWEYLSCSEQTVLYRASVSWFYV